MNIEVSALIFQERVHNRDVWVAQCLEYDIVAEGDSIAHARENLAVTLFAHTDSDEREGRNPFAGMDKAPEGYHKMFQDGDGVQLVERHDFKFTQEYNVPSPPVIKDARVCA